MKTITKLLIALTLVFSVNLASAQSCSIVINSVTNNGNGSYTFNVSTSNFNPNSFFASMWVDFGDGNYAYPNPNTTSFTHIYNNNGIYGFCVGIDDSVSACYAADCDTVFVNGALCNLYASFNISNSSATQFTFTDNSTGTYNSDEWRIDNQFGNNVYTTNNSASINYTFTGNGFYSITRKIVNNSGTYCADSSVQYVQINSPTAACSAWFYAWPDSANPGVIDIWDLSYINNIGAGSYWDMGDGTTYPYTNGGFASSIVHNYAASGFYNICLYLNDGNGCVDSFCTNVFVPRYNMNHNVNMVHQAIIHPNPNGATGIQAVTNNLGAIKVCPNPCSNEMSLELNTKENTHLNLNIKNALGQTVQSIKLNAQVGFNQFNINTSEFESGIYILQLSDDTNKVSTIKFVKQ